MKGGFQEIEKESFWKEHQDTLLRIRQDLISGKKRKSKPSHERAARGILAHPPYGKYRKTLAPYLPKLRPQPDSRQNSPHDDGQPKQFEVVPPVKPKHAFTNPVDYDSWGEESEDLDDGEVEDVKYHQMKRKEGKKRKHYKPQPYPPAAPVVYAAPFPVYYPAPPRGLHQSRKKTDKKVYKSHTSHLGEKNGHSLPTSLVPIIVQEDEEEEDEDEMLKAALNHWRHHPLFSNDFVDWLVKDYLDTELLPDLMIDTLNEIRFMPYDHPMYLPSLYACEDMLADLVLEMALDIVRETASVIANDYLDEKRLEHDPLEDFLCDLMEDEVKSSVRELVGATVIQLAEEYMETQLASGIIYGLLDEYLDQSAPQLLEETLLDISAETFIESEVIATEVDEEAQLIALEVLHYYDSKILRRELKEVSEQAKDKLADVVMMEYLLSVISQQGKLWTEDDHVNKYLDDLLLSIGLTQMFTLQKQRDKTLQCKPLHKLHEKVVSDVALDVFLQHLTLSLDEDLADVDEYERGVRDNSTYPIPCMLR